MTRFNPAAAKPLLGAVMQRIISSWLQRIRPFTAARALPSRPRPSG
ncbi:hypothetical protein I553_2647 [Mycobacterium xenopi 4042]|uniref:Uncharacterized protein n=1 Tax=Mycobacterium xenopi 4042 TaxID=1299334 RepID=X8CAV9_MYCXE|nr:hypothetical protein I553_2647 [Mycobacterium xenopi 4042]